MHTRNSHCIYLFTGNMLEACVLRFETFKMANALGIAA
jgi:hypothetical protein